MNSCWYWVYVFISEATQPLSCYFEPGWQFKLGGAPQQQWGLCKPLRKPYLSIGCLLKNELARGLEFRLPRVDPSPIPSDPPALFLGEQLVQDLVRQPPPL